MITEFFVSALVVTLIMAGTAERTGFFELIPACGPSFQVLVISGIFLASLAIVALPRCLEAFLAEKKMVFAIGAIISFVVLLTSAIFVIWPQQTVGRWSGVETTTYCPVNPYIADPWDDEVGLAKR